MQSRTFRNRMRLYDLFESEDCPTTLTELARRAGISRRCLYYYMEKDKEFAYMCRRFVDMAKFTALSRVLQRKINRQKLMY